MSIKNKCGPHSFGCRRQHNIICLSRTSESVSQSGTAPMGVHGTLCPVVTRRDRGRSVWLNTFWKSEKILFSFFLI